MTLFPAYHYGLVGSHVIPVFGFAMVCCSGEGLGMFRVIVFYAGYTVYLVFGCIGV